MKWSIAQAQAINTIGTNLVVSAGAGSGKTAVLVERILNLLGEDKTLHIAEILVMTFTEAAAGEMRQRIATALENSVATAQVENRTDDANRFRREKDSLWQAQISTIHSFCLEVVRESVLSLDISPAFPLLDGNEQKVYLLDLAEEIVEEALGSDRGSDVERMMTELRLADARNLTSVLLRLYELARSQVDPEAWLQRVASAYPSTADAYTDTLFAEPFRMWVTEQLEMADKYFRLAEQIARPVPELAKYTEWLQEAMTRIDSAKHALSTDSFDLDAVAAAMTFWTTTGKTPSTRYKGPEADRVKSLREAGTRGMKSIAPVVSRGSEALFGDLVQLSPHIRTLCHLVELLIIRSRAEKQLQGVLDFSDLEHFAYAALRDEQSGTLDRFQQRYRHVFVDEYQDTSPIQDAIVNLMTGNRNNLFAVGDVKQSIYRFRMAEPSLFLERYGAYQRGRGGQSIDLTENYRSRAEIVSFINFAFAQLFHDETTEFTYDEHARMESGASYPEAQPEAPIVEVHFLDRSSQLSSGLPEDSEAWEQDDGVDVSALQREAQLAANRIRQMMEVENVQVWDKRKGDNRPLQLGDIAILLRSGRSALNTVLDVLNASGISASGSTSTGFYDALEIGWLVSALRVVDNPRDDLALVTLLRSPIVGWDETMLAKVRLARRGTYWDALRTVNRSTRQSQQNQNQSSGEQSDEESPWNSSEVTRAVGAFVEQLNRWRTVARQVGCRDILQHILDDSGLLHYLAGMTRGEARQANVKQLLRLARAYDERTGSATLFGFLQQWQREEDAALDLGAAAVTAQDAVQVMTIHRSKGLEYPVVFVIDLGKQFRLTQDFVTLNRRYGVGVVGYNPANQQRWRTMASIAVSHAERRETLAEEARILYVALTRARERLVLVGSGQNLQKQIETAMYAHDFERGGLLTGAFMQARSYMDWMVPVLLRHPAARVMRNLLSADIWDGHLFDAPIGSVAVNVHNLSEVGLPTGGTLANQAARPQMDWEALLAKAAARPPEKPSVRILEPADVHVQSLFGKVSATDMRRLHVALMDSGPSLQHRHAAASLLEDPAFIRGKEITPREEGVAFHAFMQKCRLPLGDQKSDIQEEIDWLIASNRLSEDVANAVNVDHVRAFIQSDLGQRMMRGVRVFREQPFFHRIDVPVEDAAEKHVSILAQGVIDCLVEEMDGWLVIDYKTDHVSEDNARQKAREYEAQVATYLAALQPLTQDRPVHAYLYFVRANTEVQVGAMSLPDVFVELLRRERLRTDSNS
ncbi:helicase-exonuclease AddAB subunit AddA [Alicyclobacillus dauci]|uniref:DNA 3'-5' helicase n=1 Tax=Alicyclobacillus dauci TaxID=1475485 RepID=A0ABY6Z791_9BACL|nr:helicase-exonuclease AddAB subunit AddA [Alicyclobacillus dauci]WAH38467.1 helicase-exonuclease AddAB subunit AddA [Alicyclobacillus dauci]